LRGAVTLTIVLVAFFVIEGVASIMFALDHKRQLSGRWGWMLASGIIDLGLGAMIFAGLRARRPGRSACWSASIWCFGDRRLAAMALHARNSAA